MSSQDICFLQRISCYFATSKLICSPSRKIEYANIPTMIPIIAPAMEKDT